MENKLCTKCGLVKPISFFVKNERYADGYRTWCRDCYNAWSREWAHKNKERIAPRKRAARIKQFFKLSPEQYQCMLDAQGGRCASCPQILEPGHGTHIDHDRKCCPGKKSCGKCVRGILCGTCNVALGMVNDSVSKLKCLIAYLERYQPNV